MTSGTIVFLLLIGGAIFLLMQGLVVPIAGDQARMRRLLKRRLSSIEAESGGDSISSLMREEFLRTLKPWERELENIPFLEWLSREIQQGGGKLLGYQFAVRSVFLGVFAAFVAGALLHSAALGLVCGLAAALIPFMKLRFDRNRRAAKLEEQLPDAIDMIRRALRAGHPFSATLKLVSEEMDLPIKREFELTFSDISFGNDVRRAMLGLLERVPTVTMMSFVTAVLLQRETGGNLAEILDQIVGVVRGRFRFFRKVKTLSAEGRMSAWVLALVPLVLFGAISITQPNYLPVLIHSDLGRKLIMVALGLAIVGTLWIRKMLRIEV